MPILNSENIPAGSAFDQRNSWLPLDKFRTLNRSRVCYEAHGHGLLAFTSAVCEENFDQACLDKNLVNTLYTVELNSPLVQRFWESRSCAAKGHKLSSDQVSTEYYWSRDPPRPEHAADGWVVMKNGVIQVLVPKIGLIPLLSLDLAEVEKDIRAANMMTFRDEDMRKITRGILVGMYHASEPEASKLAELMKTCNIDVATEEQPPATDNKVVSNATVQDPTSSDKSGTSVIKHLVPRSGDGGHRPHKAKRLPPAVIDHAISPPTLANEELDAGTNQAKVDKAG